MDNMSEPNTSQSTPRQASDGGSPPDDGPQQVDPIMLAPGSQPRGGDGPEHESPFDAVGSPAKVMRIGNMIKQLLEEVRNAPLDEKGRARLAAVHERSLAELEEGLSEELVAELHRISLPFSDGETPSDSELRIAQAQLVGWLEGLFHGIQTALVAQQMAAQQQIAQMRKALPGGPGGMAPGMSPDQRSTEATGGPQQGTGQYL